MPDDKIIKRLRYFDKQFLVEADFTDEQNYHLNMRRRHNRLLHTPGIAEGLEVEIEDVQKIKVKPGVAIDKDGRELVQVEEYSINLSNIAKESPDSNVYITIKYGEQSTDPQVPEKPNDKENTRIIETPIIEAKTDPPPQDGAFIQLAAFKLKNGNLQGSPGDKVDKNNRKTVSAVLADRTVSINKLKTGTVIEGKLSLGKDVPTNTKDPKYPSVTVFTTLLSQDKPNSAFILVYAYAEPTKDAEPTFTWEQQYVTDYKSNTVTQKVIFSTSITDYTFSVNYKIYPVFDN